MISVFLVLFLCGWSGSYAWREWRLFRTVRKQVASEYSCVEEAEAIVAKAYAKREEY